MKVIVAGYSKTGTKSTNAALTILGYNVHDVWEHFAYNGDDWMRVMKSDGTVEDLKRMYKDVDVGIDIPFYYYWQELHQAFPDAKIILTVRDEDSWYKSFRKQCDEVEQNTVFKLILAISPTGRRFFKHIDTYNRLLLGYCWEKPFAKVEMNETTMKIRYRQHNEYVMTHAPKDKLLVFSVKDGWGPLCEFLGKEIPDGPFPRKNVGATVVQNALNENPALIKMKREMMMIMLCLMTSLGAAGTFVAYKRFPWSTCKTYIASFFSRLFG